MRVFIGLALLSVAFATPLIPSVPLPEAALPAMESVALPPPEAPAYETPNVVRTTDVDMQPAMIPQSVADQLNDLKELIEPLQIAADPVQIADNVQIDLAPVADEIAPAQESISPVLVVDRVDETVPLEVVPISETQVDPVRVAESPVETGPEDRQALEDPVEDVPEIKADPVIFADNVEQPLITKRDTIILSASPVDVVVADILPGEEIIADPVRVVDFAPGVLLNADVVSVAHVPVVLIPYPEKYYDSPLLR